MMKLSKKTIGIISGVSATIIVGTTIAANLVLKNENGTKAKEVNPLHPNKSDHHYSIANTISKRNKLNNLITTIKSEIGIVYVIEEDKFKNNIIEIAKDALSSIKAFSDINNYVIEVNYKINTKSILVDLVWYKPNQSNKFYDQFELALHTA